MVKFTFKTDKPEGIYGSFYKPHHHIKLKRNIVGSIVHGPPFIIMLMVNKKDINEDGNPNCTWKWVQLKKKFETLQDAKDFLNERIEAILSAYDIRIQN